MNRFSRICARGMLSAWLASSLFFAGGSAAAAPISMHVQDGDIRMVLLSVASLGGMSVVLDDSVQGKVAVDVENGEPEALLRQIAASKGLFLESRDGITLITAARGAQHGMRTTHVFTVRYANLDVAREAVSLALTDSTQTSSTDTGGTTESKERLERVVADAGTGTLVLYGTSTEADAAARVLKALDRPVRQVSLEAKVVAIQKDAAKALGIEWEWSKAPQYPDYTTEYESRRHTVQNADGSYTTVTEDIPHTTVTRSWRGGASIPGIIQFGRGPEGHPFEFYYAAQLNALITDGKANILARPNVTTLQGQEAIINIGGQVPVPTTSVTNATTTTSVTYRQAGIILRYRPTVHPDGTITATVHTEVSSPLYVEALQAYRFQERSADTVVRLKDGETMVIGGLIGSEETHSMSKVPFLGDLPILGALFRNVRKSKQDSEIMIFLTAHVLEDPADAKPNAGKP